MRSTKDKKDTKPTSKAMPVISEDTASISEDKDTITVATASLTSSILKPPSTPINLRQKLLHHALELIDEPIDRSGFITRTLDFNGINNLMDLLNLTHKDLDELKFVGIDPTSNRNKTYKLIPSQVNLLKIVQAYNVFHIRAKTPLSTRDWLNVTKTQFNDFRMIYNPYIIIN